MEVQSHPRIHSDSLLNYSRIHNRLYSHTRLSKLRVGYGFRTRRTATFNCSRNIRKATQIQKSDYYKLTPFFSMEGCNYGGEREGQSSYVFDKWIFQPGNVQYTNNPLTFVVTQSMNITAVFTLVMPLPPTSSSRSSGGSKSMICLR